VYLELDAERAAQLRANAKEDPLASKLLHAIAKPGSMGATVIQMLLNKLYEAMRAAGFVQGAEFIAAIEEAERMGAKIVYFDRDYRETLTRIAAAAPQDLAGLFQLITNPAAREKVEQELSIGNLFNAPFSQRVDDLLYREKVRTLISNARKSAPNILAALLDERDLIMANALKATTDSRIVAVVRSAITFIHATLSPSCCQKLHACWSSGDSEQHY